MARTSFSAMYRSLLTPDAQAEFDRLVSSGSILAEVNKVSGLPAPVTSKSTVYRKGFKHNRRILFGPTVGDWLESIVTQGKRSATKGEKRTGKGEPRASKDLMSHPVGGSHAMGAFGVVTEPKKKTTGQARFEVRGSETHVRGRPASEWMDYLNGIFFMAWFRRRHGPKGTRLTF